MISEKSSPGVLPYLTLMELQSLCNNLLCHGLDRPNSSVSVLSWWWGHYKNMVTTIPSWLEYFFSMTRHLAVLGQQIWYTMQSFLICTTQTAIVEISQALPGCPRSSPGRLSWGRRGPSPSSAWAGPLAGSQCSSAAAGTPSRIAPPARWSAARSPQPEK